MSDSKTDATEENWLRTEDHDDWSSTTHEQVYFRDGHPKTTLLSRSDLVKAGTEVAEALPGNWTVILSAGPYRAYAVQYEVCVDINRIHLDFYSARPGLEYLPNVIRNVKEEISDYDNNPGGTPA